LKKKSENKKPVFTEKSYSQAQRAHVAQDRGTVASTSSGLDGEREVNLLTAALLTKDILSNAWIIDSGASSHMCHDGALFSDMTSCKIPI